MPNLDSGRYFLTVLLPIKDGPFVEKAGMNLSPVQAIRDTLSVWATARQSPATYSTEPDIADKADNIHHQRNSLFAKNLKTHFTRIFVINNAVYNGRISTDTLVDLVVDPIKKFFGLKSTNVIIPQEFDQLNTPYLAYVAEIDAAMGEEFELDDYLKELWTQSSKKLSHLFQHCYGFDKVKNAGDFCQFMRKGQVETVMPFNDYWQTPPPLKNILKTVYVVPPITVIILGLAASYLLSWWWLPITLVGFLFATWAMIMIYGAKPFPMAPDSDLRSVLKSLYLQQNMIDFAITAQGVDAEELHRRFGEFLAEHKPSDIENNTQLPGTIRA